VTAASALGPPKKGGGAWARPDASEKRRTDGRRVRADFAPDFVRTWSRDMAYLASSADLVPGQGPRGLLSGPGRGTWLGGATSEE